MNSIGRATTSLAAFLLLAACGGGGGGSHTPTPSPTHTPTPPADVTPPDTSFRSTPQAVTTSRSFTFEFYSTEDGATFQMSLDSGAYQDATSPVQLTNLVEGAHTFSVRARDAAGNLDATPATAGWIVDTTAPETSIAKSPASLINSSTADFEFGSNDPQALFQVSLDNAAYAVATNPLHISGLAEGTHSLSVRAVDPVANTDATPATYSWKIDTTPPTAEIIFPTSVSYTDALAVRVRGAAHDANGIADVQIKAVSAHVSEIEHAQSTDNFATWEVYNVMLPVSTATDITVSVRDAAGNVSQSAASAHIRNNGSVIASLRGIALDSDRLFVTDQDADTVYAYSRTSGYGWSFAQLPAAVSGANTVLEDIEVDRYGGPLVVDWGTDVLWSVLDRTAYAAVSAASADPTTKFNLGFGVAYDDSNNRAFVTARGTNSVISVDLATGIRHVVSSSSVGTGAALSNPLGLTYDDITDPATPRLLVVSNHTIVAIDVATGNRTTFSSTTPFGNGTSLQAPSHVKLDHDTGRVFVIDSGPSRNSLVEVDRSNGDRTTIADATTGSGVPMGSPIGLAIPPGADLAYVGQVHGEILSIDLATRKRTSIVNWNVGSGNRIGNAGGVAIERDSSGQSKSILYTEMSSGMLMRADLTTGNRTVISSSSVGSGPALQHPVDVAPDTRSTTLGHRAFILDGDAGHALISVDLDSGDRVQLADLNSATPAVVQVRALRLDVANNRVLFTDAGTDSLYAINLDNGVRSTISGPSRGSGIAFNLPTQFILYPENAPTKALVSDGQAIGIIQVDLATGNRTMLVSAGGLLNLPGPISYDSGNNQVLAVNLGSTHLFAMNLAGTTHTIISGVNPATSAQIGIGPLEQYTSGMDVDSERQIAYVLSGGHQSLMAIDLLTGQRTIVSH